MADDNPDKVVAMGLVGRRVHFAHQVGDDVHTVNSASSQAGGWMVTLDDLPGFFAPHLFVEVASD